MEGAAIFEARLPPPVVGDRLVLVLYDQLNLAVWPADLRATRPTLVFVESLVYAAFLPHHPLKLTYILSAQRHFALDCAAAGYRVLNWRTTGTHADGVAGSVAGLSGGSPHLHGAQRVGTPSTIARAAIPIPRSPHGNSQRFFSGPQGGLHAQNPAGLSAGDLLSRDAPTYGLFDAKRQTRGRSLEF
ncbi:MAG: cryptochrome/photolyase family protein [Oscillatoriales cyanobacterium SM2_1_8]|nr:cryptochrome/photolyase family protein [Oscillatoriales cyanobacterium SM2_1_8]